MAGIFHLLDGDFVHLPLNARLSRDPPNLAAAVYARIDDRGLFDGQPRRILSAFAIAELGHNRSLHVVWGLPLGPAGATLIADFLNQASNPPQAAMMAPVEG